MEVLRGNELILRAGDLATLDVLRELKRISPVVAVRGNVCLAGLQGVNLGRQTSPRAQRADEHWNPAVMRTEFLKP